MRVSVRPARRSGRLSPWPRLLLAIVVGAGTVAACSGGGTPAPGSGQPQASGPAQSSAPDATKAPAGAATVDVCALLSVADVTAITGKETTPEPDEPSEDWAAGQCWWNDAKLSVRFGVTVGTAASIAKSSSPTAKEQYDLSKLAFGGASPDVIPGVGDEAVFASGFVFAYKGGTFVEALGVPKDQLVEIVKKVLAKL